MLINKDQTYIRWGPFLSSYSSLLILGFLDNMRGPLFPSILSDFQVNQATGSWFFSAASLSQVLTTVSASWWLKKWPSMRGLRLFLLIQSAGYLCMGMGSGFSSLSWTVVLLGAVLFGMSLGGTAILQSTLINESTPVALQRRAFSGLHGMYGTSSLMAPLAVAAFLKAGWSWSQCMLFASALPLLVLLSSAKVKGRPRESVQLARRLPWEHVWIPIILALYVAAEVGVSSRLVLFVERELGGSPAAAAGLLALFFATLLLGRLFFAFVPTSHPTSSLILTAAILSFVLDVLGLTYSPVYLGLLGLTMAPIFPLTMTLASERAPHQIEGLTTLIMTFVAAGLVLMHWGVGRLSDSVGLTHALFTGPVCLGVMIVVLLVHRRSSPA